MKDIIMIIIFATIIILDLRDRRRRRRGTYSENFKGDHFGYDSQPHDFNMDGFVDGSRD